MDILIQAHHPEAIAMRDITNSRVRFATQRLSRFVSRVVVRFTDLNGPRGAWTNSVRFNSILPMELCWWCPHAEQSGAIRWKPPFPAYLGCFFAD